MKLKYWLWLLVGLQLILIVILSAFIRFEMKNRYYLTKQFYEKGAEQGQLWIGPKQPY